MKSEFEFIDDDIRDGLLANAQTLATNLALKGGYVLEKLIPDGLPTQMQLAKNIKELSKIMRSIYPDRTGGI
jgi:hypothetical protein